MLIGFPNSYLFSVSDIKKSLESFHQEKEEESSLVLQIGELEKTVVGLEKVLIELRETKEELIHTHEKLFQEKETVGNQKKLYLEMLKKENMQLIAEVSNLELILHPNTLSS